MQLVRSRSQAHRAAGFIVGALIVMLSTGGEIAAASPRPSALYEDDPCKATGPDPAKTAIHLNKRGNPKKLKDAENSGKLFGKDRPDRQDHDQERNLGEVVRFSGYTTAVVTAGFVPTLSEIETSGYIKITVKVCNRDDDTQQYYDGDWRLQTPSGTVLDPDFVTPPTLALVPTDVVDGGTATGDVYFEVGAERGDFYIIYKPDPFDDARGIWKVSI